MVCHNELCLSANTFMTKRNDLILHKRKHYSLAKYALCIEFDVDPNRSFNQQRIKGL